MIINVENNRLSVMALNELFQTLFHWVLPMGEAYNGGRMRWSSLSVRVPSDGHCFIFFRVGGFCQ